MKNQFLIAVLALFICLVLPMTGYAQDDLDRVSVIAKLEYDAAATYRGGLPGLDACSITVTGGDRLDLSTPACEAYLAFLEEKFDELEDALSVLIPDAFIVHRLSVVFGGVSIILPKDRVEELLELPGVVAVHDDGFSQLETVASPQFIGADRLWEELGGPEQAGEGIIVGVIDTGVWPESPSFSDPDPSGNPYPPPPARWKGTACEFGSDDPEDVVFTCNNKLIGADRITTTLDALGLDPGDFLSARDNIGHGTHTLSTAAGNGGAEVAVVFGEPLAVISGVAPRAHAVAYKCSGNTGCAYSDIAAAVQQAVLDGVDVINYSQTSPDVSPYLNAVGLAFLGAYEAGVVVAVSAGNLGPGADTISSPEPWAIAVGNSTGDTVMAGALDVTANNGDTIQVSGVSITGAVPEPRPIVVAGDLGFDENCNAEPLPPEGFFKENEIVVCSRGGNATLKSRILADAGASALVMYNDSFDIDFNNLNTDKHFLPAIHIDRAETLALLAFLADDNHTGETAVLSQGEATLVEDFPSRGGPPSLNQGTAPGVDVINDGSSRGGPGQRLGISKPDLTAPGTGILAGWVPTQSGPLIGAAGLYWFQSGTSMAAPHIAGAAALLLDLHPDWTPGQIKSALMTTAVQDLVKEDGSTPADPFDRGSGRVDLRGALEPGLTFVGPSAQDFIELKDNLWNLNYPSLYVPGHPGRISVERTVANELTGRKQWKTQVSAPPDVEIVVPKHVRIPKNGTKTFEITIDAPNVPNGEVRHANLRLTRGKHEANFPITIVKDDFDLPLSKTCQPTTLRRGATTECTITASNTTTEVVDVSIYDRLPRELRLKGPVDGATRLGPRELAFEGTLEGAVGPEVTVEEGASPFGYLSLADLGIEPLEDGVVGDETITNFDVPPFLYGGETYTRIGFVGNGFAVVGGGVTELTPVPQTMPDPETPNNVIAPLWTDLCGEGTFYVATVDPDDSGIEWLVLEWEDAVGCDAADEYSFQIWIRVGTDEEAIFMVYGRIDGDGSDQFGFSVGAENRFGNSGQTLTDLPVVGRDLAVKTTPIIFGTHTITFDAKGVRVGDWENCAEMTSDVITGTALACAEGEVRGSPNHDDDDDSDDDDDDDDHSDDGD